MYTKKLTVKFRCAYIVKVSESRSVVSNSLRPHGLYSPWNSLGQNTGVGSCALLQGIFPTQGSNPGLPYCRLILYQLSHKGSPRILKWVQFSSIQSLSNVQLFVTPWTAAHQASLSITNSWSLLKFRSIESVMPSNHLILYCPIAFPKKGLKRQCGWI